MTETPAKCTECGSPTNRHSPECGMSWSPEFRREEKRRHWPVMQAYKDRKISRKQAEAQLRDLRCETWEIELFLDNDQSGPQ